MGGAEVKGQCEGEGTKTGDGGIVPSLRFRRLMVDRGRKEKKSRLEAEKQ